MSSKLLVLAGATALACALGGTTNAADASTQASSTEPVLEEIIVTAEKTTGEASKTPLALSVLSGDELKEHGVVNIAELGYLAPSVEVGSAAHGANVSIRGVSTTDITSKGEQAVSFNLDGIAIGRPQVMGLAFFDLDRIEVLRGPQGTLYGKSSTAGAINVITAKPKDEFEASASMEVGNFNARRGEGMVNLPISGNFAVRFAGSYNMRDGYITPSLNNVAVMGPVQSFRTQLPLDDENNLTGRLSALWKFGDVGSLVVQGTFGHVGGTGDAASAGLFNRVNKSGSYALQVYRNPMAGTIDDQWSNFNADLNVNLGPVALAYVGGRLKFSGNDNYSPSEGLPSGDTPAYGWNDYLASNTYDSHELRLSNAQPQRFEYVVGANYWKEDIDETDMNWNTFINPNPTTTPACTEPAPNTLPGCSTPNPNIVGLTEHKAQGAFGQGNFHVTDNLKVTLGVRYSSDSMFRHSTIAAGGAPPTGWLDANGQPCHPPGDYCVGTPNNDFGKESASKATWRVGADYQIALNQMIYGYVATGYKAGSFNDVDPTSPTHGPGSYGPESLTAYEVGYKGKPMANLEFDSSAYYYDYTKYQLTGATFLTPSATGGPPNVIIYTRVVPVLLYGWENELHWKLTQSDQVNATLSIESGHFRGGPGHATAGFAYGNQVDWSGKRLDAMPPVSGTVSYEHRWSTTDGGFLSARLGSKISSSYYESDLGGSVNPFAPQGTPYDLPPTQYTQRSYTRTDFNLGYTSATEKFSLNAYVRNIENKVQMLSAPQGLAPGATMSDSVTVRISSPRTFGIRIGVKL